MIKKSLFVISFAFLLVSCQKQQKNDLLVNNALELKEAIKNAQPGDNIVLKNGTYTDIEIEFSGNGTKENPITLTAETAGKVFIEGKSNLKIGGDYLIVKDLHFRNGYTPSRNVIQFRVDSKRFANNSKVTHCVIEEFTQLDRDATDHWVEFWGRNNELSNCYIAGKSNFGPTVMVMLKGNQHIKNYHQIKNNHFGPRPRKGGPHGETMQIGDSGTSMVPSHTQVIGNYFERCNGEVEIISSKSNFNAFKNNVFFESEGSLVLRHGNYATIDGNVFIGNDNSEFIGGIRVINTGHWITNNYFYKLKGSIFRAPLAVMNGIPKSPQNRYNQVTDAVIAHNSYIDCVTPFHFSVGSNVSQSAVLPKSEIRSARPTRVVVANNLIYNKTANDYPIKNYDKVDGVKFKNNYSNSGNKSEVQPKGLKKAALSVVELSENLYSLSSNLNETYQGFDFETITNDLLGAKRTSKINSVGAIVHPTKKNPLLIDESKYGTNWFSSKKEVRTAKNFEVSTSKELFEAFQNANSGDVITLKSSDYQIEKPIAIDKEITLISAKAPKKSTLNFTSKNTAFLMKPTGNLRMEGVVIKGNKNQNAFSTLPKNMSKAYNLFIKNSKIKGFKSVLEVSKGSFADTISVANTRIENCKSGINLNKETNNKGDYNSEFVLITNSTFNNVSGMILDYHRGGYDESTIGGNLVFKNNTVSNSGKASKNNILMKNRGIVNVTFSGNTFKNNRVKLIAILWGEKGQESRNNTISKSGSVKIVQNLKLDLMY